MISIQRYIYKCKYKTQMQAKTGGICCFGYERFYQLLTSILRHEERGTILTMLTIPNAQLILWCFRSLLLEIRKTQLHLSTVETQLHLQWSKSNSQLTLFQNPQILRTISSRHDVIHTQASFPVWGLLLQWWLSYPLRVSVKLYQWLCTWTLNPNSSKPNQTEW